jgi:hypothetical protein
MKLLVLGIDGLDYRYLSTWPYPHLKKWRDAARWGMMWSSEKRTGPSWTTIFTGWGVGHHGVTTLLGTEKKWVGTETKHPPGGMVNSLSYQLRPQDYIWDELLRAGNQVGIINSPGTPKVRRLPGKGYHVGGWPFKPVSWPPVLGIPDDYYASSADAARRCPDALKHKPQGAGAGWEIHGWPFNEWSAWIGPQETYKVDLSSRFASQTGLTVDAMIHVTQMWDRGCHMLTANMQGGKGTSDPRLMNTLGPILDQWVGYTIDYYAADAVAICSDHGFYGDWHTYQGVWGISGPGIAPQQIATIDQSDFTPTVLDYMGIPCGWGTPNKRDGWSALRTANQPTPYEIDLSEEYEDEDYQRDILKGLGYIGDS